MFHCLKKTVMLKSQKLAMMAAMLALKNVLILAEFVRYRYPTMNE